MRVLLLTQYYPPEVGATQNRMHFFARRLAELGHHVTVVAEVPNHPAGVIFPEFRRKLWTRTVEDDVHVIRVWVTTSPRKTFLVRTGFYLTYAINAVLASLFLAGPRHDVVFATSPPLTVGIPALIYAKLRRVPFVLDVRDLWPLLAVELGELRSPLVVGIARRLEWLLYRHAAAITVVTRGFASYLREQGCPDDRIVFLPNGTIPELFRPLPPDPSLSASIGLDGAFVVGFFGNHGIAQDLEGVLETARLLARGEPGGRDARVRFLLVGEGPVKANLMAAQRRLGLDTITFLPQVPQDEVARYINLSDAVLVPLRKLDIFHAFVPSKLFDFMACARPVLLQVDGEARQILDEARAGLFVAPGEPEALAAAIRQLADMDAGQRAAMGAAGLAFVGRRYLRETQVVRLDALLKALVSGRPVPEPAETPS
jgi:glycosyltransferase involved in cell wall biosynthesis